MTTTASTRQIACPKCGTSYRIKEEFSGSVRCKKCNASFVVGLSKAERHGQQIRNKTDQKMAVKLLVICGVVLLLLAGVIYMASTSKTGGGSGTSAAGSRKRLELPTDYDRTKLPVNVPKSPHPPLIARAFLRAMGESDRETLGDLFLFDWYFKWADEHYGLEESERYANASPERQAELRGMVLDHLMDSERGSWIQRQLVPALERGDEAAVNRERVESDYADCQYDCMDEKGDPLFTIYVGVRLKPGLKPEDGRNADSWGVYKVSDQWHQVSLKVAKKEKRLVDIGIGREYKDQLRARKASAGGPPEADPEIQDPVEGTGPTQVDNIEQSIRVLLDDGSSGPDYFRALDTLKAMGKPAIPYLLNALVGKNHADDEYEVRTAFKAIQALRDITGEVAFGYAPGMVGTRQFGVATATGEERETAVRRWFGWWKVNKRSWAGREDPPEEEEGEDIK